MLSQGGPRTQKSRSKDVLFFASTFRRFFLHFYLILGSLLEGFFVLIRSFFRDLVFNVCPKSFVDFPDFFRKGRTLADVYSTQGFIWSPYIDLFRKIRFFMKTCFENYTNIASLLRRFFINVYHLFGIDFRIDLFIDFSWKKIPKTAPKSIPKS